MDELTGWQRRTAGVAAGRIAPVLAGRRRLRELAEVVDALHREAIGLQDELLRRHAATGERGPDCRAGCAHCCRIRVRTTVPEVVRLAHWMREQGETEAVRERAQAHAEALDPLAGEAYFEEPLPCPLLVDEMCSIHPVRPIPCRAYLSWDAEACRHHFRLRDGTAIPTMASMSNAIHPIAHGIAAATAETGAGPAWVSLPHALAIALRPGEIERWMRREDVFRAAESRPLPERILNLGRR